MNNSVNKILVICNSDIILKGLAEILTGCDSDEVILLHHPNELIDYPNLSGYVLLIVPLHIFEMNEEFLKRMFSNARETKYLYLNNDFENIASKGGLNICDNQTAIINKVNECLNTYGKKSEDSAVNELTKREIDVLQLVSKGLANKEVADKLSISIHTVISHRKNISEKTGIKSASGLTMYAVLKKIIDIDEISTSDLI
jgi:DNA-binding CsgD family transcriptional regulator